MSNISDGTSDLLMIFIRYRGNYISGAERKAQKFIMKIDTLFGYFTTMYQIQLTDTIYVCKFNITVNPNTMNKLTNAGLGPLFYLCLRFGHSYEDSKTG